MTHRTEFVHEHWFSRRAFLLVAVCSAVGLGNIWCFPYITGVNGGGAFVIIYCVCIVVIAILWIQLASATHSLITNSVHTGRTIWRRPLSTKPGHPNRHLFWPR
ncbi:MAG: hypothetical protein IIC63_05775 [Proteobacteria bacterium]|nr:hypothetical protein [Pseudomonadota bacterium]